MRAVRDWAGRACSTWAAAAASTCPGSPRTRARVVGVEPHPPLVALARRRTAGLAKVEVRAGTAQRLPVPGRLGRRGARPLGVLLRPGLRAGAARARPGGAPRRRGVRDRQRRDPVDVRRRGSGGRCRGTTPAAVERFWARQGWSRTPLDIALGLRRPGRLRGGRPDRVRAALADEILAEHAGTEVDYAVNLFWRTYP